MERFQSSLAQAVAWVDDKIGWGRIGLLISLLLIGVSIYVLHGILQGIDWQDVVTAFADKPKVRLLMAAACVATAYFTLSFYDYLALRTLERRDIPYRTAALAGFCSYAIGHNVGATVFTGGMVRYRIYSSWGMSFPDVAKLVFIAGLTFWLGNVAVLGLGLGYEPQAASSIVPHVPPLAWRVLAVVALVALCGYVIWVGQRPREIGIKSVKVTLPGAGITVLQIVNGVADLLLCAAAMYVLLPDTPQIDFTMAAVVFVCATILGFASHAPGGLGVFDAAMLVGLSAFDREEVLASLLIFRIFYYLIPFVLALAMMGIRELTLSTMKKTQPPVP